MSVVFLIVLLALQRLVQGKPNALGARHILDERYARGDIDREEYVRKRRDLES